MKTYYISETQNGNSIRKAEKIEAKNLTSAKRTATRNQIYQGTVLSIYRNIGENGFGFNLVTSKNTSFANTNRWTL